uniref:hypothetical protein n=1 Tax=Salmonella enterica TaxID=28901 RepID=UPI0020C254C8
LQVLEFDWRHIRLQAFLNFYFLRSKLTLISMKNLLLLYHKSAILALVHGILSLKLVKKISNFD